MAPDRAGLIGSTLSADFLQRIRNPADGHPVRWTTVASAIRLAVDSMTDADRGYGVLAQGGELATDLRRPRSHNLRRARTSASRVASSA